MSVTKVIFVCHGNICRSPMGEFIFKNIVKEKGKEEEFLVTSAGVSDEEDGNDIYPPAKRVMRSHGIPFSYHSAHRITTEEFRDNDVIIALDRSNYRRLTSRFGENPKIRMLLDRDVDDPWYSGDFETAFSDILEGCLSLYEELS